MRSHISWDMNHGAPLKRHSEIRLNSPSSSASSLTRIISHLDTQLTLMKNNCVRKNRPLSSPLLMRFLCLTAALWSGTNINRDVSTGPLARPFARSLPPLTRGKVNYRMVILFVFFSVFDHSALPNSAAATNERQRTRLTPIMTSLGGKMRKMALAKGEDM